MVGKLTDVAPQTDKHQCACLPAPARVALTGIEQLNAQSQGWPRVVPKMGPFGLF